MPHPGAFVAAAATVPATVGEFLFNRFPDDVPRLRERLAAGEVVDELGRSYLIDSALNPGGLLFLYRDPPVEIPVPFDVEVLHRDDDLLVVDKPHFLAVTPRGSYVQETVLVRLRQQLQLPELSPAHRLDRLTAGVLVLTVRRESRRRYQELFAERAVHKVYEAVAPVQDGLQLPVTVRSRIEKQHGVLQAAEPEGEPNAESRVELIGTLGSTTSSDQASDPGRSPGQALGTPGARVGSREGDRQLGLFRLTPKTGKTHQLRVHMAGLGMPIMHDNLYPEPYEVPVDDFTQPLQLLARTLAFTDPLTGEHREFNSRRSLTLIDQLGLTPGR